MALCPSHFKNSHGSGIVEVPYVFQNKTRLTTTTCICYFSCMSCQKNRFVYHICLAQSPCYNTSQSQIYVSKLVTGLLTHLVKATYARKCFGPDIPIICNKPCCRLPLPARPQRPLLQRRSFWQWFGYMVLRFGVGFHCRKRQCYQTALPT